MLVDVMLDAQVELPVLLGDLEAEYAQVDSLLDQVPDGDIPTPAEGWGARETLAHLVQGEELAALAVERPVEFRDELGRLLEDLAATMAEFEVWSRTAALPELGQRWRRARTRLVEAMSPMDAKDRVPWVLGDMAAASFARARLMEAWAHGLDVADGMGVARHEEDRRLRHVVQLGIRTHGFSFRNRDLDVPAAPFRLELSSPDGQAWVHGPGTAPEVVRGPARDFAAVVTQRRHPDDTGLEAVGDGVKQWLAIAQCFAGPATDHRAPGTFVDNIWAQPT